jgi:hypothetical protein
MDKKMLSKTRLFEKIEIQWFSIDDIENKRNQFRHFYRDITDMLVSKKDEIREFMEKRTTMKTRHNKTKKHN